MKNANVDDVFELKATDLGGRIGNLRTKTSTIETPALLPVIHPVHQLVPCNEIARMGYEAVMTNAYTTFRKLRERSREGIHKIIGFEGSVMTDSGGYQVLQYGSVDIEPEEMASFQEEIGSDIAIVLDKPTGLDVSRKYASDTVEETLSAAKRTAKVISKEDVIWTLPIQGGKFLDLVRKSAKSSAELDFGCFALGSPVEVMEQYDFSLLVQMVLTTKKQLPGNRPFHLFGAGHPLVLPLAVSLGCDMFDSASYMLYAKQDRYISPTGTVRLDQLEYLGCACMICTDYSAKELRSLPKDARVAALARHNLAILKLVIEEAKQAIWEGRLWEYVQSTTRNHPNAVKAFRTAVLSRDAKHHQDLEIGTPTFKDRGLFIFDVFDQRRPELSRYRQLIESLHLKPRKSLLILPETRTKPFLKSKIFEEIEQLAKGKLDRVLITSLCPNFGLVPAELSDIYPLSQCTNALVEFPPNDSILKLKKWDNIVILRSQKADYETKWVEDQILPFGNGKKEIKNGGISAHKKGSKISHPPKATKPEVIVASSYKDFKRHVRELLSSID